MSRVNNAYYMDPVWGDVTNNLADAIGGQPMRRAQAENVLTQTRSQQQQDAFGRADRRHRYGAADAFEQGENTAGMADLMRGDRIPDMGQASLAFRGEQMAQGQATPDQMRGSMAGAGIQPGADLALTGGRADQMRLEDHQRGMQESTTLRGMQEQGAMNRLQAGHGHDMNMAQFEHQNPTGLEHALVNEMSRGNMDPRDVQARTSPMSADQTIADAHASGNPELANAIAASRYGEGPGAWAAGEGGGGGSSRDPLQDARARVDVENQIGTLAAEFYPDLSLEDRRALEGRAAMIAEQSGWRMNSQAALQSAAEELGGYSGEDRAALLNPGNIFLRGFNRTRQEAGFGVGEPQPQQQPQQTGPGSQSRPEPGAMSQPIGSLTMPGPNGRQITPEEIQATAENRGMSPQEVYEALLERGAVPDS